MLIEHPDRIGAQVSLVRLASAAVLSSSTFRSLSLPLLASFLLGALLGMQEAHVLTVKRGFAHILRLFREALASLLDPLNRLNVLLLLGLSSFFCSSGLMDSLTFEARYESSWILLKFASN